jgi:hypothetical protein
MRREGDRGYVLSGDEVLKVIRSAEFEVFKQRREIIADINITPEGEPPGHERMLIFSGSAPMRRFENVCDRVGIEPPALPRRNR